MTPGADPLHVAFAVVGTYLPHAAAMVASLVECGGEPDAVLHLLHDGGLPPEDLRAFEAMVERMGLELRSYVIPDEDLVGVPTAGFTGKGSWYRVFLPELVPDAARLLYLDVDLLILDRLTPLREIDLSDAHLGAVTNVFEPWYLDRPAALGLAGPSEYFNAGVLLMNLEAMRRDGSTDEMLRYARANAEHLVWRDQDALNVVLGRNHVRLHPRWNCMNSVVEFRHSRDVFGPEAVAEARHRPAIRHFEGPSLNKPWHYLADRRMQRLYRHHRAATPWPEVELEDRTKWTRLLRPLPAPLRRRGYVRLIGARLRRAGVGAGPP
jgi:lipopolysaccharide biosynthesis glycosyltransferase